VVERGQARRQPSMMSLLNMEAIQFYLLLFSPRSIRFSVVFRPFLYLRRVSFLFCSFFLVDPTMWAAMAASTELPSTFLLVLLA
jgi:hypothetical protein